MKKFNKKGFTLVELMIVITVIAILATIAVVSFTRVQKQARDTKRRAEIKSLQIALQAYYTEKTSYPVSATSVVASTALAVLAPTYISNLPTGPLGSTGSNTNYMYISDAVGYKYSLCVTLEAPTASGSVMWKADTSNSAGYEITDAACTVPL
jgi:general secretion pathway protein G